MIESRTMRIEQASDAAGETFAGSHSAHGWRRSLVLAVMYWLTVIPLAMHPRLSGNVWSRYMTIESIVERRTMVIEQSPMLASSGSPDIVRFDGHYYSDKPPVLSAIGAIVYGALEWNGIRFTQSASSFAIANLVLVAATAALWHR